ncbi:extracellular solute-binding protein [Herbiconiux sp. L3-i23]|uniref:sugar ABC transporter substrate-binding protein n=1 Tax=Herbiconiux sp. L3-i23 TaxID=2905871 RepID=UPI002046A7D9|nr:extracellular solute-binding protein [Herbiconiux sp. L3-i23]BDI22097.1 sugar-binding protein [Herbiconiux sp. L3-i23]
MVRNVAAAALAAALTVSVAACGGASDGGDSGGTDGAKELEMWTFLDPNSPDDPRGAALKDIVESYNEQSDGITVTVRSINYAKIDAEVIKATASNNGPDLINIYSNQLPTHVAAKTVQPMTEYAQPLLDELGDDYLFPVDGVTFDDEIMAMPWETRAWLLWYRADLLEQAGLEVPTTLDELGDTAAALQQTGKTGLAVGFSNAGLGADFMEKFIPFTWGNGGEILDGDEAVFNDTAGVEAMDYFTELHDKGAFGDEVLSMGADEVVNGVKAGTIAMAIEGSYRVGAARSGEGIGENLQTVPMPSDTAGTPLQTPVAGQTLAIGAGASDADAAWDFIQYYTSAESQAKFAAAGVLPVLSSVYDSAEVQALPNAAELATWRDYVVDFGRPNPVSPNFSELSDALVTAGQRVVFEGADAAEQLDQVAENYN